MKRRSIPYSADEIAWLEANRAMIISDYHHAFCEAFKRDDVSAANLHGLRKRKGWKVGRAKGRYVGRHRLFSDAEIAWLRENVTLPTTEWHRQFSGLFAPTDVTVSQLIALRKNQGWKTGRTGCFEKGAVPVNKGKPCAPGTGGRHPNARKTHFRKGSRTGKAAKIYKPIGTERIKDGYRERKVHDGLPMQSRWKFVHRIEWEAANGPVPEGMALKCLGDRADTSPSNWELVPRGMLPRLNGRSGRGYDKAPAQLKPTIMAVAKLEHRVREKARVPSHAPEARN